MFLSIKELGTGPTALTCQSGAMQHTILRLETHTVKLHHCRALYNTSLFRRVVQKKSLLRKNHVKGSVQFAKIHNTDALVKGKIQSPGQSCLARSQTDLCDANLTIHHTEHSTCTMKYGGGGSITPQGYFSSAGTEHLITRKKNAEK